MPRRSEKVLSIIKKHKRREAVGFLAFLSRARPWIMVSFSLALLVLWATINLPRAYGSPGQPAAHAPTALNCSQCHSIALTFHDKLGSGNKSCLVCHDDLNPLSLHLADETEIPLLDSPQLCGQCHQNRYEQWKEGIHGLPGTEGLRCTKCHDPHQPQVALLNITIPHPPATPSAPGIPSLALPLLGVGLSITTAVIILVAWKRTTL